MKNKKLIIYIHGWNSHKKARKAVLIADELKSNIDFEVCSLTLHHHPREAISQLTEIIEMERKNREVCLIGSSLGGYFSVYLAEKYNLKLQAPRATLRCLQYAPRIIRASLLRDTAEAHVRNRFVVLMQLLCHHKVSWSRYWYSKFSLWLSSIRRMLV